MRNEAEDSVGVNDVEMNLGTTSGYAAKVDEGEVTQTEPSRNAQEILPVLFMANPAGGALDAGLLLSLKAWWIKLSCKWQLLLLKKEKNPAKVDEGEVTQTEPSRNAQEILPVLFMANPAGGALDAGLLLSLKAWWIKLSCKWQLCVPMT